LSPQKLSVRHRQQATGNRQLFPIFDKPHTMPRAISLLALVLLLLVIEVHAQSSDSLISKAERLYEIGNFAKSASTYDLAFRKAVIKPVDYYNAACSHALAGNVDRALAYLKLAFSSAKAKGKHVVTANHMITDTDLDTLRQAPQFRELVEQYYSPLDAVMICEREISDENLWDYINRKIQSGETRISILNKTIYWKKENDRYIPNDRHVFRDSPLRSNENTILDFSGCTFEYYLIVGRGRVNLRLDHLSFENCNFRYEPAFITLNLEKPFSFRDCQFNGLFLSANFQNPSRSLEYFNSKILFERCTFTSKRSVIDLYSDSPLDLHFKNNVLLDSAVMLITGNQFGDVKLSNMAAPRAYVRVKVTQINTLQVEASTIDTLCLTDSEITSKFNFIASKINSNFLMRNTTFSDNPSNQIRWASFSNKLGLIKDFHVVYRGSKDRDGYDAPIFITGVEPDHFKDGDLFAGLMGTYSLFLNQFKSNNDLESYNKCFIELKELQSRRLEYLYETNGGFEAYFRWKLSQLLKFYVRYGTDPARAILISIYIIIAFGVFFFFFPSDWDTTSKKTLIANYRDFIEKNEKGYVKPFLALTKGFVLSLINAITLSLNAFITLGFGNIPTHGVARYFCVLEGFLGWFLLSIFTVALINQTL
jgi:hypothetical protein